MEKKALEMAKNGGFNLVQEGEFTYIDEGEGDVLVLLHGLFGALSNFHEVINHFKKDFRIIFPFLPLYSLSLKKSTVRGMADHVGQLLDKLLIEKAHFLGNSLGGHIALVYGKENLNRLQSLTLTGSSGLFENAMGDGYPNRESYEYIKSKTEYTFYDPKTATKELVDEVYETVNNRSKVIRIITMAKSAIRHNMREDLNAFTMPAKMIWGSDDRITPPFVGEEFNKLMPNSSLSFIDECGHAPMMEKPQEFNKILMDFLTSL